MQSKEIREKFLKFFESRGHAIIPSASLVTTTLTGAMDTTLFNTAGMQPFVPYLLGEPHPKGVRIVNVQKCLRTIDLSEVGDNTHNTFFEMLGNWSFGDYFKKEAISWSYEFLTSKKEGLGLDPKYLYITVFGGEDDILADNESKEIWKSLGIPENRIYFKSSKSNWWSAGPNSPAGPSSEMFFDITKKLGDMNQEEFQENEEKQNVIEIWNDVFMSYRQVNGKIEGELPQKNIDTGAGLERIATIVQNKTSIYQTDLFLPIINKIEELSGLSYGDKSDTDYIKEDKKDKLEIRRNIRIVADHIRTVVFIIGDGVIPSNTGRGYILRRILRRAIRYSNLIHLKDGSLKLLGEIVIENYKDFYKDLYKNKITILNEIQREENKFRKTLELGLREFEKLARAGEGIDPFILFTSYGFPIELTEELAKEKGLKINKEDFNKRIKEHKDLSKSSSSGIFKGGLSNYEEKTIKLHTAHHLLLAGLKEVIDKNIKQRGSNITEDRLRIDFLFERKLTNEEKIKVEDWVNDKIQKNLKMVNKNMPLLEAEKLGAEMEFGTKYPEIVSIYLAEDNEGNIYSKEFCGGPHTENTGDLAIDRGPDGNIIRKDIKFKIQKEEAVASGIRRIKAILI